MIRPLAAAAVLVLLLCAPAGAGKFASLYHGKEASTTERYNEWAAESTSKLKDHDRRRREATGPALEDRLSEAARRDKEFGKQGEKARRAEATLRQLEARIDKIDTRIGQLEQTRAARIATGDTSRDANKRLKALERELGKLRKTRTEEIDARDKALRDLGKLRTRMQKLHTEANAARNAEGGEARRIHEAREAIADYQRDFDTFHTVMESGAPQNYGLVPVTRLPVPQADPDTVGRFGEGTTGQYLESHMARIRETLAELRPLVEAHARAQRTYSDRVGARRTLVDTLFAKLKADDPVTYHSYVGAHDRVEQIQERFDEFQRGLEDIEQQIRDERNKDPDNPLIEQLIGIRDKFQSDVNRTYAALVPAEAERDEIIEETDKTKYLDAAETVQLGVLNGPAQVAGSIAEAQAANMAALTALRSRQEDVAEAEITLHRLRTDVMAFANRALDSRTAPPLPPEGNFASTASSSSAAAQ